MRRKKTIFKRGRIELTNETIEKAILVALVSGALVFSPMGGRVVISLAKYYLKKWWEKDGPYVPPEKDPERVRESIYRLKRNDYINWKYDKKKNKIILALTKKGRRLLGEGGQVKGIGDITISTPKKWDGQWRFFLFDIPEKRRGLRDILRARLKSIGFFQFQKSVWIHPFECKRELQYLCEYLRVTPYAIMFATQIDNDRILRRYFFRQGILLRTHLSLSDKGVRY